MKSSYSYGGWGWLYRDLSADRANFIMQLILYNPTRNINKTQPVNKRENLSLQNVIFRYFTIDLLKVFDFFFLYYYCNTQY